MKKPRGRPETKEWPKRIPDTPGNVLKFVLETPSEPKGGWKYQKKDVDAEE